METAGHTVHDVLSDAFEHAERASAIPPATTRRDMPLPDEARRAAEAAEVAPVEATLRAEKPEALGLAERPSEPISSRSLSKTPDSPPGPGPLVTKYAGAAKRAAAAAEAAKAAAAFAKTAAASNSPAKARKSAQARQQSRLVAGTAPESPSTVALQNSEHDGMKTPAQQLPTAFSDPSPYDSYEPFGTPFSNHVQRIAQTPVKAASPAPPQLSAQNAGKIVSTPTESATESAAESTTESAVVDEMGEIDLSFSAEQKWWGRSSSPVKLDAGASELARDSRHKSPPTSEQSSSPPPSQRRSKASNSLNLRDSHGGRSALETSAMSSPRESMGAELSPSSSSARPVRRLDLSPSLPKKINELDLSPDQPKLPPRRLHTSPHLHPFFASDSPVIKRLCTEECSENAALELTLQHTMVAFNGAEPEHTPLAAGEVATSASVESSELRNEAEAPSTPKALEVGALLLSPKARPGVALQLRMLLLLLLLTGSMSACGHLLGHLLAGPQRTSHVAYPRALETPGKRHQAPGVSRTCIAGIGCIQLT